MPCSSGVHVSICTFVPVKPASKLTSVSRCFCNKPQQPHVQDEANADKMLASNLICIQLICIYRRTLLDLLAAHRHLLPPQALEAPHELATASLRAFNDHHTRPPDLSEPS